VSRGLLKKAKALRKQQNAKKKANKKNTAGILVFAFVVIAVVAYLLVPGFMEKFSSASKGKSEIFSHGNQTVQLFANGTYKANLAHGVNKNGTYTKKEEGNRTIITFNVNGKQEIGRIENNSLHLPNEWDDGHGHGSVFSKEAHDHDH